MKWIVLLAIMLLPLAAAHTAEDPNSTTHDHEELVDQCMGYDPVDDQNTYISVTLLLLGSGLIISNFFLKKKKQKITKLVLLGVGLLLVIISGIWAMLFLELNRESLSYGMPGSAHEHADFQLAINNQLVDFTNDYYLSYLGHERSRYVHLHEPDNVVHKHSTGVTWGYFFETLNVTLNGECISVRGSDICNATFIRNGEIIPNLLSQEIHEGDRALFHYGSGDAMFYFPYVVGNESCRHSGTCPERGTIKGCNGEPS